MKDFEKRGRELVQHFDLHRRAREQGQKWRMATWNERGRQAPGRNTATIYYFPTAWISLGTGTFCNTAESPTG